MDKPLCIKKRNRIQREKLQKKQTKAIKMTQTIDDRNNPLGVESGTKQNTTKSENQKTLKAEKQEGDTAVENFPPPILL